MEIYIHYGIFFFLGLLLGAFMAINKASKGYEAANGRYWKLTLVDRVDR